MSKGLPAEFYANCKLNGNMPRSSVSAFRSL